MASCQRIRCRQKQIAGSQRLPEVHVTAPDIPGVVNSRLLPKHPILAKRNHRPPARHRRWSAPSIRFSTKSVPLAPRHAAAYRTTASVKWLGMRCLPQNSNAEMRIRRRGCRHGRVDEAGASLLRVPLVICACAKHSPAVRIRHSQAEPASKARGMRKSWLERPLPRHRRSENNRRQFR
jgi:hypothetical protein